MKTQVIKTNAFARQVKEMLLSNAGKFFTVTFVKKNGEVRTLNCQQGHFKGHDGENTTAHIEKYLTVRTSEGEFKKINCEQVISIKMQGSRIEIKK